MNQGAQGQEKYSRINQKFSVENVAESHREIGSWSRKKNAYVNFLKGLVRKGGETNLINCHVIPPKSLNFII